MSLKLAFKRSKLKKVQKIINNEKCTHSNAINYTSDMLMCYYIYKRIKNKNNELNFKRYFSINLFSDFGTYVVLLTFFFTAICFHKDSSEILKFVSFLSLLVCWSTFIANECRQAFKLILIKEIQKNKHLLKNFLIEEKAFLEKDIITRKINNNNLSKVQERRRF